MADLRYCGECTLCCLVFGIPELNKEAGEVCDHITDVGCSIYAGRPEPCRGFNCAWRERLFKDKKGKQRPDRLGALAFPKKQIEGYSPAVQFVAQEKKTLDKPEIRQLVDSLSRAGFYIALSTARCEKSEFIMAKK